MDSGDTVYQDYLMEWLKVQRYSISPQTLKATESYSRNQITPRLGHLTLTELSPMVLQNFVMALKDVYNLPSRHPFAWMKVSILSPRLVPPWNLEAAAS